MDADRPNEGRLRAWFAPVRKGDATGLMEQMLQEAGKCGSEIIVLDGDMVFGHDHLSSALEHAERASSEGSNSSDSIAMETLLYASGERQLSSAIRKMSVGDDTQEVVVAVVRGDYSPGEGWRSLPRTRGADELPRLKRFGITERELSTVAPDKAVDLILERVAAVDVIKK
jgi:KEOPS complex subunit Cgi121